MRGCARLSGGEGLVSDAGAPRRAGTTDAEGSQGYQGSGGREVAGLSPSEPGMRV